MLNQNIIFDTPLLRQFILTKKAGELVAMGVSDGFVLQLREGSIVQTLEAQRGHARKFKRLESVASYLKELGADRFTVELDQWDLK